MNSLSTTAVFPLPRDFLHRAEEELYWPRFSLNEKALLLCFLATAWEDIK